MEQKLIFITFKTFSIDSLELSYQKVSMFKRDKKHCKSTLLFEFDVAKKRLPFYMSTCILKTVVLEDRGKNEGWE